MNAKDTNPMPEFDHPPVIEVVCGVQFDDMARLNGAMIGLFWQRVREQYPTVEEHPPLAEIKERFGSFAGPSPRAEMTTIPPSPRLFFVGKTPNWLIQLQRNRFLYNWRTVNEDDEYPRFPVVFNRFWDLWTEFCAFCREADLAEPEVNQLEITYINHIPRGDSWTGFNTLGDVFRDLQWNRDRDFLPEPESMNWHVNFMLPEQAGRLHVILKHGIRKKDECPVLLCELTARGMSRSRADDDLRAWFHLGREWIVRGFADLTAPKVQALWGRRA